MVELYQLFCLSLSVGAQGGGDFNGNGSHVVQSTYNLECLSWVVGSHCIDRIVYIWTVFICLFRGL